MGKILLICSEFPPGPGGIGRHGHDLSLALSKGSHIVKVFSPLDYVDEEVKSGFQKELPNNIQLYELKRKGRLTYIYRLIIIITSNIKYRPDLIIFSGKFSVWMAPLLNRIKPRNTELGAFIHGSEIKLPNKIQRKWFEWGLKNCDEIWSVSKFNRNLLPLNILQNINVKVIPNGLHIDAWKKFTTINSFDWPGQPILLTVGSVTARKGQHRVIKALPTIVKYFSQAHYHIVGLPKEADSITALATEYKIDQHYTLHGSIPSQKDLALAYKAADIFIILSENQPDGDVEGFGIAILEANFFGVPAIGAKGCGIEDAIKDGYNGRLVNGNDPVEITNALKDIQANYDAYRQNAIKWAHQHDWMRIIEKIL